MGRIVSKQPNGLYCVFSTIVDNFIICDLTEEEYIEYRVEKAKEEAMEDAKLVLKKYIQPFDSVIANFHPSNEEDLQDFIKILKLVGCTDDKIKEFEEKKIKWLEEYDKE
jgi:hypothetical protein